MRGWRRKLRRTGAHQKGGARDARLHRRVPAEAPIQAVEAAAYRVPTDRPEADGTYAWESTTLVVVRVSAGGKRGLGYSYGSPMMAPFIGTTLADRVKGIDAFATERAWNAMVHEVRNLGRPGFASLAISAVDMGLWDLKGRLVGLPLATLA